MGRLLKKKTSSAKKSKKQESSSADSIQTTYDLGTDTQAPPAATTVVREKKISSLITRKTSVAAKTETVGKRNILDKGLQFLREVKVELKKVAWPSRKQTIGSTLVVIVLVMIISLYLGVVDVGLSNIVRVVLK